jgi:arabinan endo-1,5-alpha-L-arabinosidase
VSCIRPSLRATLALAAAALTTWANGDDAVLLRGDLRAHDPSSIVKEGERYYLFSTGWGLRTKFSDDLIHWSEGHAVFDRGASPDWTQEAAPGFQGHFWAPDILRSGDAYRLYYSVSRFGKQTSAIGLATSGDPQGGWKDEGVVIQSREGDPFNAIDPAVLIAKDGRHWMAFGSFWDGIFLAELNRDTGLLLDASAKPIRIAGAKEIEAPTLLQHEGWYYLFVNHGLCCRGVNSTYRVVVGRSEQVEGPYLDKEDHAMTDGGGTVFLDSQGSRIGPGHIAPLMDSDHSRFAFHYYDGDDRGKSKLAMASLRWSSDGWPEATDIRLAAPNADDSTGAN